MSKGKIFRPHVGGTPPVRARALHLDESNQSDPVERHTGTWRRRKLAASTRKQWSSMSSSFTHKTNDDSVDASPNSNVRRASTTQTGHRCRLPGHNLFHASPSNKPVDNPHSRKSGEHARPTPSTRSGDDESINSNNDGNGELLWTICDDQHVGSSAVDYFFWSSRPALGMFLFVGLAVVTLQPLFLFGAVGVLVMQVATVVARWMGFLVLENDQLHECLDYVRRYFGWLGKHGKIALDEKDRTRKIAFGLWYRVALPVSTMVWNRYYRSRRTRVNQYAIQEASRFQRIKTGLRTTKSDGSDS